MKLSEDGGAPLATGLPLDMRPLTEKELAGSLNGGLKDANKEERRAGPPEPLAGSSPIRRSLTDTGT
jgi:hypothetical protein